MSTRYPRLGQGAKTELFARWLQGSYVPEAAMLATGRRIWVGSAEANAGTGAPYGISPNTPLTTLAEAVTLTLDGQHDVILVMPGHTEDITAADIATTNTCYSIIGIGKGSDRPTFTMTEVGSTFHVNSINIHMENLIFVVGATATTAVITIEADDFSMKDCDLSEGADQAVSYISVAGAANVCDRMHFDGVRILSPTAGSTQGFLLNTVEDDLIIENCYVWGNFTAAAIVSTAALFRVCVRKNIVVNLAAGVHAIEFSGASTGAIVENQLYSSTWANALDPGSCWCSGNYATDAINQSGVPIPLEAAGGYPTDYLAATSFAADAIGAAEIAADAIDGATYAHDAAEFRTAVSNWNFAGDTGAVAAYTVFTVTGDVLVQCYGICDVACVGAGSIQLGIAGGFELIASTVAANLIANELWHDATPTTTSEVVDLESTNTAVISNGADIQFSITGAVLTDGDIDFYCRWLPLSINGNVVAA